ncbi:hypothetical protein BD413DRAFT_125803 [Trametes elegans]|nr:hypothetical protein BD413DRAFT_125803 [Trametes elegans]
MKSPIIAFSLFVAAAATATAQDNSNIARDVPLSPTAHGNIGALHVKTPRQYPTEHHAQSEDLGRNSRGRPEGERASDGRVAHIPPPGPDKVAVPSSGDDLDGGVSQTAPATGTDAGEGGGDTSTTDSGPASGWDIINLGNNVQDAVTGGQAVPDPSSNPESTHSYNYSSDRAHGYPRMRRVALRDVSGLIGKRDDGMSIPDALGNNGFDTVTDDEPDNDNSGQDGADGVSQRGSETPGSGPYGGQAHSGSVGSSQGGHVYNEPASD